jgi:hypothetical protein
MGGLSFVWYAYSSNGASGFPLDDSWIHLQFARNLHDFGAFSFFGHDMVTAGSTSPLYTFLLAIAFFLTTNEFLMSYALGVAAHAAGAFVLYTVLTEDYRADTLVALSISILFALHGRLLWAAASGMETTLFILTLLAALHFYEQQRPVALGVAAGLSVWTRPEGLLLIAVLFADAAYRKFWVRNDAPGTSPFRAESLKAAVLTGMVLIGGYFLMNLLLSGTLLPNTFAAKTAYYASGGNAYPARVWEFLTGGPMLPFALLATAGLLPLVRDVRKRRRSLALIPLLWVAALVGAYAWKLPVLHLQGRYMMPLIPFVLLLAALGVREIHDLLGRLGRTAMIRGSALTGTIMAVCLAWTVYHAAGTATKYALHCAHIAERQVRTAHWIRENLPEDAVVATHDIGALGFYSQRRIVDMVGLVSPGMIATIGRPELLPQSLVAQGVSHLAVLRSWFEVDNVEPLMIAGEGTSEIMEVFEFDPQRMIFLTGEVGGVLYRARVAIMRQDLPDAEKILSASWELGSGSARYSTLLGQVRFLMGDTAGAGSAYQHALELNPLSREATIGMAELDLQKGDAPTALKRLQKVALVHPSSDPLRRVMERAARTLLRAAAAADSLGRK